MNYYIGCQHMKVHAQSFPKMFNIWGCRRFNSELWCSEVTHILKKTQDNKYHFGALPLYLLGAFHSSRRWSWICSWSEVVYNPIERLYLITFISIWIPKQSDHSCCSTASTTTQNKPSYLSFCSK